MKIFLKVLLLISIYVSLNANQLKTDNIANIAKILVQKDHKTLQKVLQEYIKANDQIVGLKVTNFLKSKTYIEVHKNKNKIIQNNIPKIFHKYYKRFESHIDYVNGDMGKVIVYYKNNQLIHLSLKEKEWLNKNTITLGVDDDFAPLNFKNSQNELDGLSIDYIKLIEQKIGHKINLLPSNWSTAFESAVKHNIDGVININKTKQRAAKLLFTQSYIETPMFLISNKKSYKKLSELNEKTILVKSKTVEYEFLSKNHPNIKLRPINTYEEAFRLIAVDRADGVIGPSPILNYKSANTIIPDLKKSHINFNDTIFKRSIAVRNSAPILLNILNKAIDNISVQEKQQIHYKWMTSHDSKQKQVLSYAETIWLKENPLITLATFENHYPLDFKNNKGELLGFHSEMVAKIKENLNVNVQIKTYKNWSEAYNAASNGKVHGILGLSKTKHREKTFFYSIPYHINPYYLVVKKEHSTYEEIV